MNSLTKHLLFVGFILSLLHTRTFARDSVLSIIPDDAVGFAIIHNIGDVNRSVGEVAKLVRAPAPNLIALAEGMTGIKKGLDTEGDVAVVLTAADRKPQGVVLVPVSNFDEFFSNFDVKPPESGTVEVQVSRTAYVAARKGNFAALATVPDREALEKVLASTKSIASDKSMAEWLDANKASLVLTSAGIKQVVPKILGGLHMAQEQVRKSRGENNNPAVNAFQLYIDLLGEAQNEVDQFGVGLRIDSAQNVSIVKRVLFTPGGDWAKLVADVKPASEPLFGGLAAKPFVVAIDTIIPRAAIERIVNFSIQMMQNRPGNQFTPEQAKKYAELSTATMQSVERMQMLMGIPDTESGLYGNTTALLTVDDSKRYMESYRNKLDTMRKLAADSKSSAMPVPEVKTLKIDGVDGLQVTMSIPQMNFATRPGAPDPAKMMKLFAGPEGKMTVYIAPADEHTVAMGYTSIERLKDALAPHKSNEKGLFADPNVAKTAAALPQGSQVVAYFRLSAAAKVAQQFATTFSPNRPVNIPDVPENPPIGMSAKITPAGVEGSLVITADTLRTIGDTFAKTRKTRTRQRAAD